MSLLIKGIDMPPDIEGAEVIIHIKPDGTVFDMRGVHLQAQAVEVPTPHGRLIDADEFFDKIPPGDIEHDEKISRTGAIADVCTWVLSAPTVIEAEEVEE